MEGKINRDGRDKEERINHEATLNSTKRKNTVRDSSCDARGLADFAYNNPLAYKLRILPINSEV
jgi:hypothetical protein